METSIVKFANSVSNLELPTDHVFPSIDFSKNYGLECIAVAYLVLLLRSIVVWVQDRRQNPTASSIFIAAVLVPPMIIFPYLSYCFLRSWLNRAPITGLNCRGSSRGLLILFAVTAMAHILLSAMRYVNREDKDCYCFPYEIIATVAFLAISLLIRNVKE